jgi:hypothetical protein
MILPAYYAACSLLSYSAYPKIHVLIDSFSSNAFYACLPGILFYSFRAAFCVLPSVFVHWSSDINAMDRRKTLIPMTKSNQRKSTVRAAVEMGLMDLLRS